MEKSFKMKLWFWLSAISSLIYIVWRAVFTLPIGYGVVAMIAGIALFVSEFISMAEAVIQQVCMSHDKEIEFPVVPEEEYPDVDILIATHSEQPELLFKTVNGCTHIEYPDKEKVHIYLCDDGNREEIAELAKTLEVGYIPLADNKSAKAGNLNNALSKTSSPLIVTLDSDMIPQSRFLMETVGYFFLPTMICENGCWRKRREEEIDPNYKIGFVQTPQSFYNPDLFQFNFYAENNIPNEQDFFFREINVGRNSSNSAIYAGSNTVISRRALEDVGGIRINTITEDFATGIDIQSKGYTTYAVPKVLASGLAPDDLPNLIKQRQRWGRGCVQVVRSFKFLVSKLSLPSKLSYLSCLFYWWTFFRRIVYILSPILFAVFGVISVKITGLGFILIWAPTYLIYNHSLKLLSGKTRDQKWSNIVDTILAPYMIIPIFMETIGLKQRSFYVTNKEKKTSRTAKPIYAIPHIILLLATVYGLVVGVRDLLLYLNPLGLIVLFWLVLNAYFLIMAVFFMTGRINLRGSERFSVEIPVSFKAGDYECSAVTSDISESGLSFIVDYPVYLNGVQEFALEDGKWPVTVPGQIVHVRSLGNKWKYSVKLEELDIETRKTYYELIYDRTPTLATEIKSSFWTDVTNFLKRKTETVIHSNRHLPRIPVGRSYESPEAGTITVVDFNYKYATLKDTELDCLTLPLSDSVVLNLKKSEIESNKGVLYEVLNANEVSGTNGMHDAILSIMKAENT